MQRLWDRMRRSRFAVLGRVGMDLYADPPGTQVEHARAFTPAIGGSAGNIAVALARQGAQAALLTRVSDDAVGRYCRAELTRYGVDTSHIGNATGDARTSLAVAETRADDCQVVIYRNRAADFTLTDDDIAQVDYASLSALVITGTALAADPSRTAALSAMKRARAAGALTVLDIDYRAYTWADAGEAACICLDAARSVEIVARDLAQGALVSILKLGPAGSQTFTPDYSFATPVFPVAALKPMGAGDGFMGGLLAGLAQGHTLETAVRRGSATAAIIVAGIGCAPASPDRAALDAFLARH
jgi:5-dehydro-2-deoxygluconokinase